MGQRGERLKTKVMVPVKKEKGVKEVYNEADVPVQKVQRVRKSQTKANIFVNIVG